MPQAQIIDLGANSNMTPEQALAVARRMDWEKVLIVGFTSDDPSVVCLSSHMIRESALWIIEHAKLHVMDRL